MYPLVFVIFWLYCFVSRGVLYDGVPTFCVFRVGISSLNSATAKLCESCPLMFARCLLFIIFLPAIWTVWLVYCLLWFVCSSSWLCLACSKTVVPVLVLLFVALWFILRGDLFYVLLCVILFLCFSVLLALRLPRLGKRKLILVLFVRLFD